MDAISRRLFCTASAGIVGAAVASKPGSGALAAERKKLPVTVRDSHLSDTGKPTAWEAMRAIGAEGAEVWVDPDLSCPYLIGADPQYSIASDDGAKRLAADANENELIVSSFAMANRFDERLDEELKAVTRVAEVCKQMGVRAIRIDVVPRKIRDDEEFLMFAISACKKLVAIADDADVLLGIENHGSKTNDVAFLVRLFDGVGSGRLGLTLDTGNFYWYGHSLDSLYAIYEKFAARAFHTHCKSIGYPEDKRSAKREMGWEYGKYNCPIYDGDIDFKRVVSILRKAGYAGDLCIEDESLGKFPKADRAGVLSKEIVLLKALA